MFDKLRLKDDDFRRITDLLFRLSGIHMAETKKPLVESRLQKRLRHYNFENYTSYIDLLESGKDREEVQLMVNLLTTNETFFFRENKHFEYLTKRAHVAKDKNQLFRVWSAACSTGEEPYSIAMILDYHMSPLGNWEIYASDINNDVIKVARDGIYPDSRGTDIPDHFRKRYCLKGVRSNEGKFMIIPELRSRVNFLQQNLNSDITVPGKFDIIFLRNVMIYFNKETKKNLLEKLYYHLKDDGSLIVGHSEGLVGITDVYTKKVSSIYVKR